MPPIRRMRPSPPSKPFRKRFKRPRPQLVTIIASVVILFVFLALSRATLFTSKYALLPENSDASNPLNSRHAQSLDLPLSQRQPDVKKGSERAVISADGSIFYVDHQAFTIAPSRRTQQLAVTRMNHIVGEAEAKLAFFLQISEANMPFLPRLLTVLWHPSNLYLIHFDYKIPREKTDAFRNSVAQNARFSNVHFMPSEHITYMGVSMLLNTLSAIEHLLSMDDSWDYFINLSGSDYPLVNVANMRRILGQPDIVGRNVTFLQVAPNKKFWVQTKEMRFNYVFYDPALGMHDTPSSELVRTKKEHPSHGEIGIQFLQAEAWVILHRSFAQHSVRSAAARKLLLLLSLMKDPEEHFFVMLAWNDAHFNGTLAHHALRGIYWKLHGKKSGQHPYYIDDEVEDGSLPFWDPGVVHSRCFFARKFRHAESALLDRIDQMMSGTHAEADMKAVEDSLIAVKEFVGCLAKRDPAWTEVLWHPPCNYTEYAPGRKRRK